MALTDMAICKDEPQKILSYRGCYCLFLSMAPRYPAPNNNSLGKEKLISPEKYSTVAIKNGQDRGEKAKGKIASQQNVESRKMAYDNAFENCPWNGVKMTRPNGTVDM